MSVAMAFILSLQASATQFIKEVMLIGGSKGADVSELDGLKQQLIADGWTFMDYDLNKGGYGCYIFMLYKAEDNTDGLNWGYITDFFMTNQSGTVPETFVNNGRTYHLVPYSGQWDFTSKQGNLNAGTGSVGEDIHLYYTKDPFPDNHAISTIFFSQWKDEPVVHLNGGSTLGDFNLGCTGYQDVFLHYSTGTVTPNQLPVSELDSCSLELCKLSVKGWAYDPNFPEQSVSVKVSIYQEDGTTLYREETITGNPGFSYNTIITDPGTFVVKAFTTDINTNETVQIGSNQSITNNVIVLNDQTGELTLNDGDILTGTGGTNTHVTIAHGATVALANVTITDITNDNDHQWAGITCAGNATIILVEGTTNNVKGGHIYYPGIQAGPSRKTLTIRGYGTLNASGNQYGAGIGGCYYNGSNGTITLGNIVIEGGIINATGGVQAAGIGGGQRCSIGNITISGGTVTAQGGTTCGGIGGGFNYNCGNITITDGVTSVTAIRGNGAPYCIGKGSKGKNCGTVTIGGLVTGQIALSSIIYKPADASANTITFDPNGGTGSAQNRQLYYYRPQSLTNSFTRTNYIFNGWNTAADGSGTAYAEGQNVINLGSTTLYAQWKGHDIYDNAANDVSQFAGTTDVTLSGRTINCDGNWNTLCLPFSLPTLTGTPLEGFTVMELNPSASSLNGATLRLNFTTATSIEAGKPYIVKKLQFSERITSPRLIYLNGHNFLFDTNYGDIINLLNGNDEDYWTGKCDYIYFSDVTLFNFCDFKTDEPIYVTGYALTKSFYNLDFEGEKYGDPSQWTLFAKKNEGDGWTMIDSRDATKNSDDALPLNPKYNPKNFNVSEPGYYQYFHFVVTKSTTKGLFSLAELSLQGHEPARLTNPTFYDVTVSADAPTTVESSDGIASFTGSYSPLASTAGLLLDANNPNNRACRATLSLDTPERGGLTFSGWYTDKKYNNPVTTIPFADNGSVTLYAKFTDGTANVAFAKEGYSTYYNSLADAVLPAGMKARIITSKAGGQALTYQTVADGDLTAAATNKVPAGTAVMLQVAPADAAQNIDVTLSVPAASGIGQDNLLHGSDAATTTTGGDQFYKLSYNRDGAQKTIGWYWGAQNAGAFTSGAHKAWLALPSDGQHAPVMGIGLPDFFEGTTDVVIIAAPAAQDDVWYDIYGRELTGEPQAKGVYIHGGKTIMIK